MSGATPSQFFAQRASWINDADAITARQNENGQWEVVMRIDGFYSDRTEAQAAARSLGKAARQAANKAAHAQQAVDAAQQRMDSL